jgi:DNA polymerase sigma
VPLIKIKDQATEICCDISMENDLSLYKASLLRCYVAMDARFPQLLCLVKTWAQARNINDAAHHTLNSFGYTLLVIQFLQMCSPPVLPSLQVDEHEHEHEHEYEKEYEYEDEYEYEYY